MEFPVPLLTLLQLQSYLVPCISAQIFIIPKLQNIHWRQFIYAITTLSELFFLSIECLSNYYFDRPSPFYLYHSNNSPDWAFRGHISRALPTEIFFYLLRSIPSEILIRDYSGELKLDPLEIIIIWLQVSVNECNR